VTTLQKLIANHFPEFDAIFWCQNLNELRTKMRARN